jgi:aquaporin TIP
MSNVELSADSLGLSSEDLGPKLWTSALAEGIAVLLFVFISAGSVIVALDATQGELTIAAVTAISLAHGLAIGALVAMTAKLSGGHVNPAVTFAAVITRRMKVAPGVVYIVAQLIGAVLGALLLQVVLVDAVEGDLGSYGGPSSLIDGVGAAVVVEATITFVLVFVVFSTAMDPRRGLGHVAPLFIGLAILIGHLVAVPLTGPAMNPARAFGPALVSGNWLGDGLDWVAIYVAGPLIGAALAAVVYMVAFWDREEDA